MGTDVQDVLKVSVVFAEIDLLESDKALASFSGSVESEVLPDGIIIGNISGARAERGRVLRLPRHGPGFESGGLRCRVFVFGPPSAGSEAVGSVAPRVAPIRSRRRLQRICPGCDVPVCGDRARCAGNG